MKPHSERFAIWVHIKRKNVSFSSFQNSERIPIMWPVFNQSRSYSSWSRLIQKKPTSIVGQKLISTIKRHKIPHSDTDPGYLLEDINGNVRSSRESSHRCLPTCAEALTSDDGHQTSSIWAGFTTNTRADGADAWGGCGGMGEDRSEGLWEEDEWQIWSIR